MFSNVKNDSGQKSLLTSKSNIKEVKFALLLPIAFLCCNSFEISKQRITIARVRQGEAKSDKVCRRLTVFGKVRHH